MTGAVEFPDTPGVVYGPINHDVFIPCELDFPSEETLELLMWYKGATYIIYKGKTNMLVG